jgi:hypothetical protein
MVLLLFGFGFGFVLSWRRQRWEKEEERLGGGRKTLEPMSGRLS